MNPKIYLSIVVLSLIAVLIVVIATRGSLWSWLLIAAFAIFVRVIPQPH